MTEKQHLKINRIIKMGNNVKQTDIHINPCRRGERGERKKYSKK